MDDKKKLFKGLGLTGNQINTILKKTSEYEQENDMIYDILGKLYSKISYDQIIKDLKEENFGINKWNSTSYEKQRETRLKRDKLASYKVEVKEGEIKCSKCHQHKTVVVELQTRSGDEGYTYQIYCLNEKCGHTQRTDNF